MNWTEGVMRRRRDRGGKWPWCTSLLPWMCPPHTHHRHPLSMWRFQPPSLRLVQQRTHTCTHTSTCIHLCSLHTHMLVRTHAHTHMHNGSKLHTWDVGMYRSIHTNMKFAVCVSVSLYCNMVISQVQMLIEHTHYLK